MRMFVNALMYLVFGKKIKILPVKPKGLDSQDCKEDRETPQPISASLEHSATGVQGNPLTTLMFILN